jgi:hypothetical protein
LSQAGGRAQRSFSSNLLALARSGLASASAAVLSCGYTDTTVGSLNTDSGVPCAEVGYRVGPCRCRSDGDWLCRGRESAECRSIFVSGGGAPLVSPPATCESVWSACSDGHRYRVACDGLRCTCFVDDVEQSAFFGPRCADEVEAATECAWSMTLGGVGGTLPTQGGLCDETPGIFQEGSDTTLCSCDGSRWSCTRPQDRGCSLVGAWVAGPGETRTVEFRGDGTWFFAPDPDTTRDEVERGEREGIRGTWQLGAEAIALRSFHVPRVAGCESEAVKYTMRFEADCGEVRLGALTDGCEPQRTLLGDFAGARR